VDARAENSIVIFPGANRTPDAAQVALALAAAMPGDTLLLQNETTAQVEAARTRALRVIYSAAPFELASVTAILPHTGLLVMNEGEAAELRAALGSLPELDTIITQGAQGATWFSAGSEPLFTPAFRVTPQRWTRV
jgi:ribokinase